MVNYSITLPEIVKTSRLNGRWVMPFKRSRKLVEKVKNAFEEAKRKHARSLGGMSVIQGEGITALVEALDKDKELTQQVDYEKIARECNGTIAYQELCILDNGLRFLRFTDNDGKLIPIRRLQREVNEGGVDLILYHLDTDLGEGLDFESIDEGHDNMVHQSVGLWTDVKKRRIVFDSDFFIGEGQTIDSLSARYFTNINIGDGYHQVAELRINTDSRHPALVLRLEDYKNLPGNSHQLYFECDFNGNPVIIEGFVREEIERKPTWEIGVTHYERRMLSTCYPNKGKPHPCDPARKFSYPLDSDQGKKLAQFVLGSRIDIANFRADIRKTLDQMVKTVLDKTYLPAEQLIQAA